MAAAVLMFPATAGAIGVESMMDGGHGTSSLPPCNQFTFWMAAWNSLENKWYRCIPVDGNTGFWAPI